MRILLISIFIGSLFSCASTRQSLYESIGGEKAVEAVVDNFIREIEYDPVIIEYFAGSNIDRFKAKLAEQICFVSGGPCQYTGDSMAQVHTGMNITEAHFNRTVDLLISAMNQAGIHPAQQNKLLAKLAPMRKDMLYK